MSKGPLRQLVVVFSLLGLVAIGTGCSSPPSGKASAPTTMTAQAHCAAAPFVLPSNPTALTPKPALVSPTTAAMNGSYRTLGVGQSVTVAAGAMHSDIVLARGVSNNEFAVSVYSHGAVPLQPVRVLGIETLLYPGSDLPGSHLVGRIPFASGPDRFANACDRWELQASGSGGLDTSQLAAYAEAVGEPESGYRGIEDFCAVGPVTGTIHYDATSGELSSSVLTVSVGGLPPDDEVNVNWSNDHVRAPVIADFATDSKGNAIQSSVDVGRLGEVRGVEIVLTASAVPNPVLGRLEPC